MIDIKHQIWNKEFCAGQFEQWGDTIIRACEDCPDKDSCEVKKSEESKSYYHI